MPAHRFEPLPLPAGTTRRRLEVFSPKLGRRAQCRTAALRPAPQGRQLRAALVRHRVPLAVRTRPAPGPGIQRLERTNTSPHDLLQRCEALLRQLLRHRQRELGIKRRAIAQVAQSFSLHRCEAGGLTDALAFVLSAMYWRGCSVPSFLKAAPMHPATGLVRWLASFSVIDQVDCGRQLFDLLALEEARIFCHAHELVSRLHRMAAKHSRGAIALLPELLLPELSSIPKNGSRLLPRRSVKSMAYQPCRGDQRLSDPQRVTVTSKIVSRS